MEVNERVQQLAKMVETMSARLVLIETQLKAIQGAKLTSEQTLHHRNPTEGGESQSHNHTLSQEDEEDCVVSRDDPLVTAAPISMATETSFTATNPAISKTTASRPTCTYSNTATSSTPDVSPQTSLPHAAASTSRYRPATNKAIGSSGTALSSQLARIRADQQLPLPLSPHPHTHPSLPLSSPHPHTPLHSIVHTPKASDVPLSPSLHSPSSPVSTDPPFYEANDLKLGLSLQNDTTEMLASLRDR